MMDSDDHHPGVPPQQSQSLRPSHKPGSPDPEERAQTEASQRSFRRADLDPLVVDDNVVAPIEARDAWRRGEVRAAAAERSLHRSARQRARWREKDRAIRQATGKDPNFSEAIIIADQNVPFRLLTEILFTLGQCEFAKFHLMVMQGSKG